MIIHHITIRNLYTYDGKQTLELPVGEDPTLTVVVAPNNSGKTSIIRALKFFFYGEKGLPSGTKLIDLVNNGAKARIADGEKVTAWVEVKFTHPSIRGEQTLTLRRIIQAEKRNETSWNMVGPVLGDYVPRRRQEFEPDTGPHQRLLNRLVPQSLFDAFYFKGEPLDGKVLEGVTEIRRALGEFLHEEQWKDAEKAVRDLCAKYGMQQGEISRASKELTAKQKSLNEARETLDSQQKAHEEKTGELEQVGQALGELERRLARLGDQGAAETARRELQQAMRDESAAAKNLDHIDTANRDPQLAAKLTQASLTSRRPEKSSAA